LYEAKKAQHNLNSTIVVEGYLDVIALAQFGILNVAATLGTAISTKQIQLLLRNTSEYFFVSMVIKQGARPPGELWKTPYL